MREVSPQEILPSQNFLKEKTVRFILQCIAKGQLNDLPPTPLVRKDENGKLIAIDGHNLIAVHLSRHKPIKVIVAESAQDGLPPTTDANIERNKELAEKFDTVLEEQRRVAQEGIENFSDLLDKYPDLFNVTA
ncbi:MAG TPA: hypothetical protein VLF59_02105 [Candidatus Saccharimonadales bacterium]|nr:hypothetical protein [Candidatus Saccharimonadales bacterium]